MSFDQLTHLRRVVAQEVDRLAHLADGIGRRSCPPRARSGRSAAACAPPCGRRRAAGNRARAAGEASQIAARGAGGVDQLRRRLDDGADQVAAVGRIAQLAGRAVARPVAQHRLGAPALATRARRVRAPRARCSSVRSSPTEFARAAPKRSRGRAIRSCGRPTGWSAARLLDRIGQQLIDRTVRIGDLVHERGVGAVLQQPAHEIGEQRLVRADRRIDAARHGRACPARPPPRTASRPCHGDTGTRTGRRNRAAPSRGSSPASGHCGSRTAGRSRRARPAASRAQAR